ncbi:MAG: peptide-modifying radical SAM enzyme CbpB [Methanomassiliicoccus sp.]|nr:peptide-modifying radical SAM enzyme CbpB [Methanomassiliicoccus sp.]
MIKMISEQSQTSDSAVRPFGLNTGKGPHLQLMDVGEWYVLLDPETMFWALVSKEKDLSRSLKEEILPLYREHAEAMGRELQEFRSQERFSAVYFNPTGACNAACKYCYLPDDLRRTGHHMSYEEVTAALDNLHEFFENYTGSVMRNRDGRRPVIVFHGSEPMLVKDVIKQVVLDHSDRFVFGVQTNGYHLDDDSADFFMDHKVSVGVSLDSPIRSVHDSIRPLRGGEGSMYDRAVHAIEHLDGYKAMSVICTISSMNVDTLPEMIDFLADRNVPSVLMNPVRGTQDLARKLRPANEVLIPKFMGAVERAIERTKGGQRITIADFSNLVLGIVAPMGRRLMCDITPCGGGRCFVSVASDGSIYPCSEFLGLADYRTESVFRPGGVERAVKSPALVEVRSRYAEKIPVCGQCALRNICGAPCPGEVYSETGSIMGKSPYCEFYEAIIRQAFQLIGRGELPNMVRTEGYDFRFNIFQ